MKITASKLLRAIVGIAIANPHTQYNKDGTSQSCTYSPSEDNPRGCIVGAALGTLGVPDAVLVGFDSFGGVEALFEHGFIEEDVEGTSRLIRRIQSAQDVGNTWGDSVTNALRDVIEYP